MKRLLLFLALAVVLTSCEDDEALATTSTNNTPNIIGSWELTSLQADVAIDFNNDGTSNTELFNETFCFDNRILTFDAANNFSVDLPDLDTDANNVLSCTDASYSGTYTIDMNSRLSVTVPVNGGTVTDDKVISVTATTITFTVTRSEVTQYFNPASGTPADNINSIAVTYTKI
jgi:hypothetical protein